MAEMIWMMISGPRWEMYGMAGTIGHCFGADMHRTSGVSWVEICGSLGVWKLTSHWCGVWGLLQFELGRSVDPVLITDMLEGKRFHTVIEMSLGAIIS